MFHLDHQGPGEIEMIRGEEYGAIEGVGFVEGVGAVLPEIFLKIYQQWTNISKILHIFTKCMCWKSSSL